MSLRTVGGIDALIALQGSRIRSSGAAPSSTGAGRWMRWIESSALLRLKAVAADLNKVGSGDEKLDQVLGEIELRVAVELAKAGINSV